MGTAAGFEKIVATCAYNTHTIVYLTKEMVLLHNVCAASFAPCVRTQCFSAQLYCIIYVLVIFQAQAPQDANIVESNIA